MNNQKERINFIPDEAMAPVKKVLMDYIERIDPISGPNLMRCAAQLFTDNGNGAMTLRRQTRYAKRQD